MAHEHDWHNIGFLRHRDGDLIKNRYAVLSHLGGGNFGSVYRVRDEAVGNELACKEMHVLDNPATAHNERNAALELFKREALNLATVRHPHIPAAYFEQEDGLWNVCPQCGFAFENAAFCPEHGAPLLPVEQRFYLMMDFIDGPTLEDLCGGPLDEVRVLQWIEQIAGALRGLHRVGIVHRDVKPENIKIRREDAAAMLLDFGLTRKAHEASGYGTVQQSGSGRFGTPGYAPPQPHELAHPAPRSDIYALGMTLYRALSGRDPQNADDLRALKTNAPRAFNPQISREAERIILTATQADAARRYADIDALLADLHEILQPHGKAVVPPFTFADGTRVRTPPDLARLMAQHPLEASNYLQNGMLLEWLKSAGFAAAAQAAQRATAKYPAHPAHALETLRRALLSTSTLKASGALKVLADAEEFLPQLEIAPAALDFGNLPSGASASLKLQLRNRGDGLIWGTLRVDGDLPGLQVPAKWDGNDVEIEIALDTRRVALGDYRGTICIALAEAPQIEEWRVPVSFTVKPLQLQVEPAQLDFGSVPVGEKATLDLQVSEIPTRHAAANNVPASTLTGVPRGTIYHGHSLPGLRVPERFENSAPFEITLDATASDAVAQRCEGTLQLDTNGGRLRVPVRYAIVLPPLHAVRLLLTAFLFGAAGALLLRLSYGVINPPFAWRWLARSGSIAPPEVTNFAPPLTLGALLGLLGAVFWMARATPDLPPQKAAPQVKSQGVSKKSKNRRREHLLLQGVLLGIIFGALLGWPLLWVLHWTMWGFLDWLLWPVAYTLGGATPDNAPWWWMGLGGCGGVLWSMDRVFTALGKNRWRYILYGAVGLTLLAVLIHAMLFIMN